MVRRIRAAALFLIALPAVLAAEGTSPSFFSLAATPVAQFPVGASTSFFVPGAGLRLGGRWVPAGQELFFLDGAVDYRFSGTRLAAPSALSFVSLGLGGGIDLAFTEALGMRARAAAGGYLDLYKSGGGLQTGGNPSLEAGLEAYVLLGNSLSLELGAGFRHDFGLYDGIGLSLGLSWTPAAAGTSLRQRRAAALSRGTDAVIEESADRLLLGNVVLEPVFPVLFKYYFDHPIGTARVINRGKDPMEDLSIRLVNRQYMDASPASPPISLAPGQSGAVDLRALFTDTLLQVTEGTRAAVEIEISYSAAGRRHRATKVQDLLIEGRNALTWNPDSKAAAFITAKDPVVLAYAKAASAIATDWGNPALPRSLLTAMAFWHLLHERGIRYTVDPLSSYAARTSRGPAPDFLQFPRETLRFGGGDCDDLTLLNAAVLEAAGVETAMLTVPGHIYLAFRLEASQVEAASRWTRSSDLISRQDGGTWVPVEVTELGGGFLKAWETGAREWREASGAGTGDFIPVHEAWTEFEAVGLPGEETAAMPPAERTGAAMKAELAKLIDREVAEAARKAQQEVAANPKKAQPLNKLGVVYARWGIYDKAEQQFLAAAKLEEYPPALLNLGNLALLAKAPDKAAGYFNRVLRREPGNAPALIGLARANHAQERWSEAKAAYEKAAAGNPGLAKEWAWLAQGAESAGRAGLASPFPEGVSPWAE